MALSPLPGIQSFQSGIGDGDDLKVLVREDLSGGWFPVLRSGWFYVGHDEGYLFAKRSYHTVTGAVTGALGSYEVTGLEEDPTELGPVRMRVKATGKVLQRVCSPLRPFQALTFSASGELQTATVSGFVVSVVSDPLTGIYLQVSALEDILSSEDYVYEPRENRVRIKDNSPPSVYATWLVPESDTEQLKQYEIARVDPDGKVRTQLSPVCFVDGLKPVIRKPTATGAVTVTGTAVSGNAITLPASGIVSGDLVAVEYYVQGSFSAVYDAATQTLKVRYLAAASGDHFLEWEGGETQYYDTSQLPPGHPDRIQLNPLLERQEPCFLYLCDNDLAAPTPNRVLLTAADQHPVWSADTPEPVLVRVQVEDAERLRVPKVWIDLSAKLGGKALTDLAAKTDWHGRALFQVTPNASGSLVLTATVRGTAVSGTLTLSVQARAKTEAAAEQQLGKLLLHLESVPFRDRLHRLNAHYVHLDGAPFQPDSSTESSQAWQGAVQFSSLRSALYTLDGRKLGTSGSVLLNPDSLASVLVDPVPGDVLRAEVKNGSRRRLARPVRVLDRPSTEGEPDLDLGAD